MLGTAGTALTIPLLPSLLPRELRAAPGDRPIRLAVVYTPNGQHPATWLPTGSETTFQMSPVLAPLEAHRAKLNVIHGLVGTSGHEAGHSECLTGRPLTDPSHMPSAGPSLDQLLAKGHASEVALESLQLGVDTGNTAFSIISYSDVKLGLPPQGSARGGFERVAGVVNVDPAAAEVRRAQSRSVLDSIMQDHASIRPHLSANERVLLDAHFDLVRAQELRLAEPLEPIVCEHLPTEVNDLDIPSTFLGHIDTIAAAFACDVTRVATLVMGGSGYYAHYEWAGVNADFHECAHGTASDSLERFTQANTWHAQMFAALLDRLDSIPDGDGTTLLDNTIVLWTNELGLHEFGHSKSNMGIVLAGGAAGYFSTGRFIDLAGAAHYHDLLLTIAHAAGRTDLATFGDEGKQVIERLRSA
ncbi:MAG: DUF1552 domain-containing protein [Polyangiaceae bacterium]|nr:DUF1552 domain-containing protein [Polyangiaceae bacterium]